MATLAEQLIVAAPALEFVVLAAAEESFAAVRAVDTDPATIGTDPTLARTELGWRPGPELDTFLREMLDGGTGR